MNQNAYSDQSEISLLDILHFFKGTWKVIAITGLAGLIVSVTYLVATPKKFEAVAQIAMAQISAANNNNSINPLGVNIEEPSLLISRLSFPTSFPPLVLSSCGINESSNLPVTLSKSIKLTLPKGVANVVELKTLGKSSEVALTCARAIFELIKDTQAQMVAPYIADAKIKLDDDMKRLAKAKDLVAKADKQGSAMGAAYLSTRDEISFLLDEITALKNVVSSNHNRATRVIAPIYVSDAPISPKVLFVLVSGLLSGLFLGLILSLMRHMWARLKVDSREQAQGLL